MPTDPLDIRGYSDLPLWAQVLLATRLLRRGVLRLAQDCPKSVREQLAGACEALERCAIAGAISREEEPILKRALDMQPTTDCMALATSVHYAADAAFAAEASLDFSAAESACTSSAGKAMVWASEADGMNALQAHIYLAADLDLLKFACGERGIGRYDGLTRDVLGRLVPVD